MKLCCPYCLASEPSGKGRRMLKEDTGKPFRCRPPDRGGDAIRKLARREFGLERVADAGRRGRLRRRAPLLHFLPLHLLAGGAVAPPDATRLRADLDDLEVVFLARLERTGALERAGAGAVHGRVTFVAALAFFDFG